MNANGISKTAGIREERRYAIRYDKEDGVQKEELPSDKYGIYYRYAKMKDGNILISSEPIDDIRKAESIILFDVVKGKVKDLTYNKLNAVYDDNISGNVLTMFE